MNAGTGRALGNAIIWAIIAALNLFFLLMNFGENICLDVPSAIALVISIFFTIYHTVEYVNES